MAAQYRELLLSDRSRVWVTDHGAGSKVTANCERRIADIARHAAVNQKFGRLLFRIARHYKPERIIELGTSLGIGTYYLASGCPEASVTSVEGDPALVAVASRNLRKHQVSNVRLVNDTFDHALASLLPEVSGKTLVFIDGNHNRDATLRYAEFFLSRLGDGSIIVLDDINWSAGMQKAWKETKNHEKSTLTVDLFRMGIVFIKRDFFRENYTIRF